VWYQPAFATKDRQAPGHHIQSLIVTTKLMASQLCIGDITTWCIHYCLCLGRHALLQPTAVQSVFSRVAITVTRPALSSLLSLCCNHSRSPHPVLSIVTTAVFAAPLIKSLGNGARHERTVHLHAIIALQKPRDLEYRASVIACPSPCSYRINYGYLCAKSTIP